MEKAVNFFVAGMHKTGDQQGIQHPSREFSAYQIMVRLQEELSQKLKAEQDDALARYGSSGITIADPVLVLAKFEAREEVEETLLRWLPRIVGQQEAFSVAYNNYGSMPGYPLYIRVQDPAPFRQLSEGLRIIDGLLKSNDYKPMQVFHHPRLVIAQKIAEQNEMEVLLDFSGRSFRAEMNIEELLLVKSEPGQDGHYVVCRLMLSPKGLKKTDSY